jgi:hypothetical protein
VRRIGQDPDAPWVTSRGPRHATRDGFDLHADVAVPAGDRARLESLCRYVLRPPYGRRPRRRDSQVAVARRHHPSRLRALGVSREARRARPAATRQSRDLPRRVGPACALAGAGRGVRSAG